MVNLRLGSLWFFRLPVAIVLVSLFLGFTNDLAGEDTLGDFFRRKFFSWFLLASHFSLGVLPQCLKRIPSSLALKSNC